MRHLQVVIFFMVAILPATSTKAGTIYKCKNQEGSLLYQEKPCTEEVRPVSSWSMITESQTTKGADEAPTGTLVLSQGNGGHYFVDGAVNDQFLNFVIDTGATTVALPQSVADSAGLRCKNRIQSRTANGVTNVCTTVIQRFKFGNFTFEDVEAIIAPSLSQPLLGMNVLKRFRVEQENGQMRFFKKY